VHSARYGLAAVIVGALAGVQCGGGGGGSYNPPPTNPGGGGGGTGSTAVITIRADGTVDPKEVRVSINDQVQFVNQDTRAHQPQSNPHLVHTDCPSINRVGVLQPGERRTTDPFTVEKACGFHDHMNPDTAGLGGTIRVAGAEGPPGPVYVRP
jgi:hypothetical protein